VQTMTALSARCPLLCGSLAAGTGALPRARPRPPHHPKGPSQPLSHHLHRVMRLHARHPMPGHRGDGTRGERTPRPHHLRQTCLAAF
jgi:hypothetical protein